ncbi:MAG TPA: hypothetical protein VLX90_05420, partial [Steroidobacteraceae bacterium]|nr:hypothetical protein [Steroidobacteraceae bacterium]
MSTPEQQLRARNLRTLALLAGLFILPLALSFWMYYGSDWRPLGRVNHGELISPVRPLPPFNLPPAILSPAAPAAPPASAPAVPHTTPPVLAAAPASQLLRGKWLLVYVGDGRCDEACRHTLYVMRQTRLGLNNEMTRVARVFLVTANCCDRDFLQREHVGLMVLDATGAQASGLLEQFPAERAQSLFIVDPLGNLLMRYDARTNPKG